MATYPHILAASFNFPLRRMQSADKIASADLFANASSFEHIPIKLTNVSIEADPHSFK
jgi:hypothetical protein